MKKLILFAAALIVFAQCAALAEDSPPMFDVDETGAVTAYYGDGYVFVPDEINGVKIRAIGDRAFFDLGISSVYISEGIESIGVSSFEGSNIDYVVIPKSVKSIGAHAFENCASLNEVDIGNPQTVLGEASFYGTNYLSFVYPCGTDKSAVKPIVRRAKGDDNFGVEIVHTDLEAADDRGRIYKCGDCGFYGTLYRELDIPFSDIPRGAWYESYVKAAYSMGIINGKSESSFEPDAGLTCAEAVKIAASIRAYRMGGAEFPEQGDTWYAPYEAFCRQNGIIEDYIILNMNENITRAQMAYLFSRCDDEPNYLNDVPLTDIPDVHDTTAFAYEILDLYNKGIAAGSDASLTFHPDSQIKRSEAAALVARILCPELRLELPKG